VSIACSFHSWVPQKHSARQNEGCVNPSFSEHPYPHASPPVTEPAQGAPRAIRGQPSSEFVRMPNYFGNPPGNSAAKIREALTPENNSANRATNPRRTTAANTRETVQDPWQSCLPESTGGEACSCRYSREGGVQTSSVLASTVLFGYRSTKAARCGHLGALVLKAFSLLRFFVAKDQEMTRRPAQGLIVIKKSTNI
jgi:hypothetical protein